MKSRLLYAALGALALTPTGDGANKSDGLRQRRVRS